MNPFEQKQQKYELSIAEKTTTAISSPTEVIYLQNKNTKVRSFKSSENIQKEEGEQDCTVSNNRLSSIILHELTMEARESIQ